MSKRQALQLYKALIRESKKFPAYNFRHYALRKIRDSFRENRQLTDQDVIRQKMDEGVRNLDVIKRQVVVSQLYSTEKLVIEHVRAQKN
ncbi:protein bcn92 [Tribolium castaneum]|uniref:Protein bcn92-like Protein n=1 Tax=Tribolium castaneum TaxID=7070 RepID=A0A139WG63_TRICA|nr:PREDICTED: protein bcn92 [Tribolium castaneum]KYB26845.1 Protein bcn92-like Protein [Tribolium castaneum]|eukprot:XP_967993.1 PREDICTED: protein bcn92 [Tribolium castaneum]